MYIHMNIMAKTIMVADAVYHELKVIKERENKSYSEVILESLHKPKLKTGEGLRKCLGLFKDDKEYDGVMKESRKMWKKWTEHYA